METNRSLVTHVVLISIPIALLSIPQAVMADQGDVLDDENLCPYTNLTLQDVKAIFQPHYRDAANILLTENMHAKLEEAACSRLKWLLEADLDAYRWLLSSGSKFFGRRKMRDPKLITREQAAKSYESVPDGPYRRIGFADKPFIVREKSILDLMEVEDDLQVELWKDTDSRLGGQKTLIVEVRYIAKCTPRTSERLISTTDYRIEKAYYCYDALEQQFLLFRWTSVPPKDVPIDLISFKQGTDNQRVD